MKNLYFLILVVILFSSCGKNVPVLPQSYGNISFDELMKTLELKKTYDTRLRGRNQRLQKCQKISHKIRTYQRRRRKTQLNYSEQQAWN